MFYEIIYEDGSNSVASYDSDEEALRAITEHHRRATEGELALASAPDQKRAAVRVVKVLVYEVHPNEYRPDNVVDKKEVIELLQQDKDSLVNVADLAVAVRGLAHPMVDSGPHESNYAMEEVRELKV